MSDDATIAFYSDHAEDYAHAFGQTPSPALRAFIADLPKGAHVLDLGCGAGHASKHMQDAGLHPDPTDAAPGMVAQACAQGLPARLMRFNELDADGTYDAVWANFSLTHAPKEDLPAHLAAIARALKPSGLFHIGIKTGDAPHRDSLGRLYYLIPAQELAQMIETAGMRITNQREGLTKGFDGEDSPFVVIRAQRHD